MKLALYATALLVLISCTGGSGAIRVGGPIPDFELETLDGDTIMNYDLLGEPVVLNFWATWCGPCRAEIPDLMELHNEGVKVVAISVDTGGYALVDRFVKANNMEYTIVMGNEKVFRDFNGSGIPYTLVLDKDSNVVSKHIGTVSKRVLQRSLDKL